MIGREKMNAPTVVIMVFLLTVLFTGLFLFQFKIETMTKHTGPTGPSGPPGVYRSGAPYYFIGKPPGVVNVTTPYDVMANFVDRNGNRLSLTPDRMYSFQIVVDTPTDTPVTITVNAGNGVYTKTAGSTFPFIGDSSVTSIVVSSDTTPFTINAGSLLTVSSI